MDDINIQLIEMLCENARLPVATLAKKPGVARDTVQNRLAKLEREGVIATYTLRLKPQVDGQMMRALMTIASDGVQASEVLRAMQLQRGGLVERIVELTRLHGMTPADLEIELTEADRAWLMGDDYTIADIAIFPWVRALIGI